MSPTKINFKIYQGSTFSEVLRWESKRKKYKTITGISNAAPCVITSTGHGVPNDWRVKVTNVVGMTDINSTEDYHIATVLTANTIELNDINSIGYKIYTSGGILEYNEPVNLTGVTGRMQLRGSLNSTTVIYELTTANGGIIIDPAAYTITIFIAAANTTLFTFSSAVYSLELILGSVVIPFTEGNITLVKEVTR